MKGIKLANILEGIDYTPKLIGNNLHLALGGIMSPAVVGLHCVNTNSREIILIAIGDIEPVCFPAGSFLQGHIYEICIAKIIDLGGANFVGYLMN